MISNTTPVWQVAEDQLNPISDHLKNRHDVPASRMFLIKQGLLTFKQNNPEQEVFDASQGDGGESLPGVSLEVLDRALDMHLRRGTGYDMPFGNELFRKSVIEDYWRLDSASDIGPNNVIATHGGRDALIKAYQAMLTLGHGRLGDVLIVSRVPWISYTWGPYGIGANVLLAPGEEKNAWGYSALGIKECVNFVAQSGRKVAGLIITSPDNPTGRTISATEQAVLAKTALEQGVAFVLFDWMYHYVTDEEPMDLNAFLANFSKEEKKHLMFMDGITKSLGASNIRNAHLIASEEVVRYISAFASHSIIPSFYSMAVAQVAYKIGMKKVARTIVEPTNKSRAILANFLTANGFKHILGKGYYAFICVEDFITFSGMADSEELAGYLAKQHGLAVIPGKSFSEFSKNWIRFSYAMPPKRTFDAAQRLLEGLNALK